LYVVGVVGLGVGVPVATRVLLFVIFAEDVVGVVLELLVLLLLWFVLDVFGVEGVVKDESELVAFSDVLLLFKNLKSKYLFLPKLKLI